MIAKPLPKEVVLSEIPLCPHDALWGFERGLLGWRVLAELAAGWIEGVERVEPSVVELAALSKSDASEAGPLLQSLAATSECRIKHESSKKWIYLTLRSLWLHNADRATALDQISELAAEFGYPESLYPLDPMMPILDNSWDPTSHTLMENEGRLVRKWREFLVTEGRELGSSWQPP